MDLAKRFFPLFFIFFVWFVFSSPYFLKGKVPFPSTYQVNNFHPWSLYEKFWGPVKNGAMPDVIDQIYPWRHLAIETWKMGQIPFWNPYSFAGNPHLANFQSAVFSPLNILFFVLPFVDAWSIMVLLQPLIAGMGMYFFLRKLGLKEISSAFGSVAFMFCGFIVVWMAYGTLSMAIAILPWALYFVESYFQKQTKWSFIALSFTIAFSFFSGHFQTSLYFFIFLLFYILFKGISSKKYTDLLFVFLSCVVGFIISSIQLIPSIQFYFYSPRSEIYTIGGGIPFYYLITLFSPDFFGNPVTRNDWFGYYAEWSSFIGIIPFSLSFFSLINRKKYSSAFFLIAGIFSVLLAIDSPFQSFLASLKLPVISTSSSNRIIVLFSFSFAVLSAIGLENLTACFLKGMFKRILVLASIPLSIITSVWIWLFFHSFPVDKLIVAKRNLYLPTVLFLFFSLYIILLSIKKSFRKPKIIILGACFVLLASSFDSLRFVRKWMPFDKKELVFPSVPVITGIKNNINHGRIFGNLGAHVDTYYGFPNIEGYDPLYISRYSEFVRASGDGSYLSPERSVVGVGRHGKYINRLLDILGVSLIYHPIADTGQSWAFPVWKDPKRFLEVYKDNKFILYRNTQALPRGTIFYNYKVASNKMDIIKTFYDDNFDYKNILIMEEKPSRLSYKNGVSSVSFVKDAPNEVILNLYTSETGLLFLSDNYYPGWTATVNSKKSKIYRANYSFRAVEVPKGKSIVEFVYFPSF